jgi:hypothetical protein
MEMAYRERWQTEIAELQRLLSGFDLREDASGESPATQWMRRFKSEVQQGSIGGMAE